MQSKLAGALACALASLALCAPAHAAARYRIVDLGTAGGAAAYAYNLSPDGLVAGAATQGRDTHAVLFSEQATPVDLGTLGGTFSSAYDVDAKGVAVGVSDDARGVLRAFVWKHGRMTRLPSLVPSRDVASGALGINETGVITGFSPADDAGHAHATVWRDGRPADLGVVPGARNSSGHAINRAGHVAGYSTPDQPGLSSAFLYHDGTMEVLAPPSGQPWSVAHDLNDADQVVGWTGESAGPVQAFVYDHGAMTLLGYARAGDTNSWAQAINAHGVVVGASARPGDSVGAVRVGEAFVDLNSLVDASGAGWVLQAAEGVDDDGVIAGSGTYQGVSHVFLAVPLAQD